MSKHLNNVNSLHNSSSFALSLIPRWRDLTYADLREDFSLLHEEKEKQDDYEVEDLEDVSNIIEDETEKHKKEKLLNEILTKSFIEKIREIFFERKEGKNNAVTSKECDLGGNNVNIENSEKEEIKNSKIEKIFKTILTAEEKHKSIVHQFLLLFGKFERLRINLGSFLLQLQNISDEGCSDVFELKSSKKKNNKNYFELCGLYNNSENLNFDKFCCRNNFNLCISKDDFLHSPSRAKSFHSFCESLHRYRDLVISESLDLCEQIPEMDLVQIEKDFYRDSIYINQCKLFGTIGFENLVKKISEILSQNLNLNFSCLKLKMNDTEIHVNDRSKETCFCVERKPNESTESGEDDSIYQENEKMRKNDTEIELEEMLLYNTISLILLHLLSRTQSAGFAYEKLMNFYSNSSYGCVFPSSANAKACCIQIFPTFEYLSQEDYCLRECLNNEEKDCFLNELFNMKRNDHTNYDNKCSNNTNNSNNNNSNSSHKNTNSNENNNIHNITDNIENNTNNGTNNANNSNNNTNNSENNTNNSENNTNNSENNTNNSTNNANNSNNNTNNSNNNTINSNNNTNNSNNNTNNSDNNITSSTNSNKNNNTNSNNAKGSRNSKNKDEYFLNENLRKSSILCLKAHTQYKFMLKNEEDSEFNSYENGSHNEIDTIAEINLKEKAEINHHNIEKSSSDLRIDCEYVVWIDLQLFMESDFCNFLLDTYNYLSSHRNIKNYNFFLKSAIKKHGAFSSVKSQEKSYSSTIDPGDNNYHATKIIENNPKNEEEQTLEDKQNKQTFLSCKNLLQKYKNTFVVRHFVNFTVKN